MAMRLADLCAVWSALQVEGDRAVPVTGVTVDSQRAGPGALFVAVRGSVADGHDYVSAAVAAGCAAVAVEGRRRSGLPLDPTAGRPPAVVLAPSTLALPARFARVLHERPDARLTVAAVTGTNGKTTVAFLLRRLLSDLIGPCGLLGTVSYEVGGEVRPAPLTTPDGPVLYALLAEMVRQGERAVALEISSHALDQERVADLALDVAVLTNLGRDHLDYHRDLESYLAAKLRIVERLREAPDRGKPAGALIVNADDPVFARQDWDRLGVRVVRFSARRFATGPQTAAVDPELADVFVERAELSATGIRLDVRCFGEQLALRSPLVGRFNVENIAAALAAGVALGLPATACADSLAGVAQVPGRLERIALPGGVVAVVDYAHTPDALAAALTACRELTTGRLLLVFGCGGDRDRGKRPLMGAAAARGADAVWITADNPRGEEPVAICEAIAAGFETEPRSCDVACAVILDRTSAIEAALVAARQGDVILIAGKGHEDHQLIGGRRLELDDRRIVRAWMAREGRHA